MRILMGKKYFGLIFWLYIIVILIATIIPWSTTARFGFGFLRFRLDYWFHFGAYFGIAFLLILWQVNDFIDKNIYGIFLSFSLCIAFSFATEVIQLFVPVRSFDIKDFIAGSAGVTMAYFIFIVLKGSLKKLKHKYIKA